MTLIQRVQDKFICTVFKKVFVFAFVVSAVVCAACLCMLFVVDWKLFVSINLCGENRSHTVFLFWYPPPPVRDPHLCRSHQLEIHLSGDTLSKRSATVCCPQKEIHLSVGTPSKRSTFPLVPLVSPEIVTTKAMNNSILFPHDDVYCWCDTTSLTIQDRKLRVVADPAEKPVS